MIPKYSDNPNLKKTVIVTVSGEKEYRANCRLRKGQYYVKNKDCFEINGKWYYVSSGLIVLDYETGKMCLKSKSTLLQGIVDYNAEEPVMGFYSPNMNKNTIVIDANGKRHACIDEQVAMKGECVEDISTGVFVHPEWTKKKQSVQDEPNKKKAPPGGMRFNLEDPRPVPPDPEQLIREMGRQRGRVAEARREQMERMGAIGNYGEIMQYRVEDNEMKFEETVGNYNKYPISYSKDVKRYAKFLEGRTFGIEYETKTGFAPQRILSRYGLIPLRDGSLHGGIELSTIPLSGAKGLQSTVMTCNELSKRCGVNLECSLHIHFGTLKEDRLLIVAMYHLCKRMQEEMYEMFPYYKTNPKGLKGDKNYCQKLRPLTNKLLPRKPNKETFQKYVDYYYTRIFTFLMEGVAPNAQYNRKNGIHPVQQKWNQMSRYYWVNEMNLMLSTRRTIEFRLHQGTLNPLKTINWLFICNAIIGYAQDNSVNILSGHEPIGVATVLNWYKNKFKTDTASFLSEYLIAYFNSRREEFRKAYGQGDGICNWDLAQDPTYKFTYKGVSALF